MLGEEKYFNCSVILIRGTDCFQLDYILRTRRLILFPTLARLVTLARNNFGQQSGKILLHSTA